VTFYGAMDLGEGRNVDNCPVETRRILLTAFTALSPSAIRRKWWNSAVSFQTPRIDSAFNSASNFLCHCSISTWVIYVLLH
jgi:hypothetical protein